MGITGNLSKYASNFPSMAISITSGLAGLIMKHATASRGEAIPLVNLFRGDIGHFTHQVAMNYTGIDTYGNLDNSIGSMLRRMTGTWVAVIGNVFGKVLKEGL